MDEGFEGAFGIKMAEERLGQRQTRHDNRIAAVHHPGEPRVRRDDAFVGHIAPAAEQAIAQILRQCFADELGEVEAGEGEGGHASL